MESATEAPPTTPRDDLPAGPAGLERRVVPGLVPTVEELLPGESGVDDVIDPTFYDRMRGLPVVEYGLDPWSHPPPRFPMPYTNVSMIAATFTIPTAQARELVPKTKRLKLVRLSRKRTPISFFAFDYRRSGLGAYHEVGVALPVVLDRHLVPPYLPAAWEALRPGRYKRIGMYTVQLPVDQERACTGGIELYGLPKVVGEASFEMEATRGSASLSNEGQTMAELRVELNTGVEADRITHFPLTTHSIRDGRIISTRYETIVDGYRGRAGRAEFVAGDHPRFAPFRALSLSPKPIEVRFFPRLNWIIWGPRDKGPL